MSTGSASKLKATAADLLALPADLRAEVIAGDVVEKASPTAEHGYAQLSIGGALVTTFGQLGGGGRGPGGWWILTEVEVELETSEVYRPDVTGWRRERMQQRPRGRPIRVRPDWVCEVLSPSNAENDLVTKLRVYHRAEVPHYWIVDPVEGTLIAHRWQEAGYLVALAAKRGESVRAEPFDAIELDISTVIGEGPTPAAKT